MADERSRRGLNPNAQTFIPNTAARPFIPGQPYVLTPQPPPVYHHPPPSVAHGAYPVYHQYEQSRPTSVEQPTFPGSTSNVMHHEAVTAHVTNTSCQQHLLSSGQQSPLDG